MKITRTFTAGHQEHGCFFFKSKNLILCEKKVRSISKARSEKIRITVADDKIDGAHLLKCLVARSPLGSHFIIQGTTFRGHHVLLLPRVNYFLRTRFQKQIQAAMYKDPQAPVLKLYFKIEEVK